MPNIDIQVNPRLPKMAWLAELNGDSVQFFCGTGVKHFDTGVFEGGWSLTDTPARCDPRGIYAGSGLFFSEGSWKIVAPTQTTDRVYVVTRSGRRIVSNSLACALEASDVGAVELGQIRGLWSSVYGLDKYARTIFHQGDKRINAYTYGIVDLNTSTEVRHTPSYQFNLYEDYRDFLTRALSDIHATAEAQEYAAYLSSGYDSVACASLMKRLGGGLTMSVAKGRQGRNDNGAPIAQALGLPNITITAKERRTITDERGHIHTAFEPHDVFDIGEFGLGTGLQDAPLKVDPRHVRSKVVLTGFHGDKVWDKHAEPSDDIKRGDSSGTGFYEYRLRTGFVHVVVPMLGALQHRQINAISNSPEMAPWSVGGQYDRPISRRMAEEIGVPRHLFGQKKNAVAAQAIGYDSVKELYFAFIRNRYSEALYS